MANPLSIRKRVFPQRRAPDGSAFTKCDFCGVNVAIVLYDMHECKLKGRNKRLKCKSFKAERLKSEDGNRTLENPSFSEQPRSAFSIFMESFKKENTSEDRISVDRKGFEKWKCMSVEVERHCFFLQAEEVNSAYEQALLEEVEVESVVDDEADSANVGRYPQNYEEYDDWEDSESFEIPHFKRDFFIIV